MGMSFLWLVQGTTLLPLSHFQPLSFSSSPSPSSPCPDLRVQRCNLSPVQLPDFAAFGTASLPRPAGQGSLQIERGHDALPVSRLNAQMSRFPICWGPFLRSSDPACRYPCIAAVVSLWGDFPARIIHTGDLLESDHQPFSRHTQANVNGAVSVTYYVTRKLLYKKPIMPALSVQ